MTIKFADLVEKVAPSVVGLLDGPAGGSGAVIAPGLVVTLARNVPDDDVELVTTVGPIEAHVTGRDASVDLAVLRISDELPALNWSAEGASPLRIGTPVSAFGDPGGHGLRATTGRTAAVPRPVRGPAGRLIEGVLEHTAPLPRGAGGGPLLDEAGDVLGLNAVRLSGGLILAWPADALSARVGALAEGRRTAPLRIGVALASPGQTRRLRAAVGLDSVDGLLVRDVEEASPAAVAGLSRGDVLLSVGDSALDQVDAIYAAIDSATGGALSLRVLRGTEERTISVTVGGDDQ